MIPILEARGLTMAFPRRGREELEAVHDVSFRLERGQALGVVGGSGSGKSTLARLLVRLLDPTAGTLLLDGRDVTRARGAQLRQVWRSVQMVFQSPAASFDPRRTLLSAVAEPLQNAGLSRRDAGRQALALLERCGLDAALAGRLPRQVSGGQCQRAAIARTLAAGPRVLVCDEVTSALDVTVQRQILDLLQTLRREQRLSFVFISHDLAVVQQFCSHLLVLHQGRAVEQGSVDRLLAHPQDPYTRALIDAAWQAAPPPPG